MTQPITWRNVDAPRFSDALSGMSAAQQSFNGGIGILEKLLTRQQAVEDANWQQGKVNNTNAALDLIMGAKNQDELASKQAALAALRQTAGAQMDVGAVRQALDQRPDTLRQRAIGDMQMADLTEERALRPELQNALIQAAQGQNPLDSASAALRGRYGGSVAQTLMSARHTLEGEDIARKTLRMHENAQDWTRQHQENQDAVSEQKTLNEAFRLNTDYENQTDKLLSDHAHRTMAEASARARAQFEGGILSKGTMKDPGGVALLTAALKGAGFSGEGLTNALTYARQKTSQAVFRDGSKAGQLYDVPVQVLAQAIIANRKEIEGKPGNMFGIGYQKSSTSGVEKLLEEQYKNGEFLSDLERSLVARDFVQNGGDPYKFLDLPRPERRPSLNVPLFSRSRGSYTPSGDSGQVGGSAFDVVLGNGKFGTPPKPLTSMSIGEAHAFGREVLQPNSRAAGVGQVNGKTLGSSALGAFQITSSTLEEFAPKVLGKSWKDLPFTPENQDKIAEAIFQDSKDGNLVNRWEGLKNVPGASTPGFFKNKTWPEMRNIIAKVESRPLDVPDLSPGETAVAPTLRLPKPQ